jgi:outer membrane protein assembly factor BamB
VTGGSFLVVGAPNETSSGQVGAGNAYVFNSTTGSLLETLTSPSPQVLGAFGWSVAVSGHSVIAGAPGENASQVQAAGQVYVFSLTTGKLLKTLSSPNPQAGGEFGGDMATSGSLLVVGAVAENTTVGFAGRAYIYNVTTGSLIGSLQSPNPQYEGEFGSTIFAMPGYVIIGAQNETTGNYVGPDASTSTTRPTFR